jgi:N-acetylmuramoyl-L-alanine amidase
MPNDNRFDRDEDTEFNQWKDSPPPEPEDSIPASVTFMELMRQAAARSGGSGESRANRPAGTRRARQQPDSPAQAEDAELQSAEEEPPEPPEDASGTGSGKQPPRRRKSRRPRRVLTAFGGFFRSLIIVGAAAGLMATIFTWWTPSGFISTGVRQELSIAMATSVATAAPTLLPTPNWARRIGIVAGHRGPENDPGAVCPDGLTEAEINFNVAQLVVQSLRGRGYSVDLLDEFDPRLDGYQAAALISVHANTCQTWPDGEVVSGYLIAAPSARISSRGNDEILVDCVSRHYALASGLERREGVTVDMTDYHSFREIHSLTPAAIIELGFMLADRAIMADQPDLLARGITDGVLCFLEPGEPLGDLTEPTAPAL